MKICPRFGYFCLIGKVKVITFYQTAGRQSVPSMQPQSKLSGSCEIGSSLIGKETVLSIIVICPIHVELFILRCWDTLPAPLALILSGTDDYEHFVGGEPGEFWASHSPNKSGHRWVTCWIFNCMVRWRNENRSCLNFCFHTFWTRLFSPFQTVIFRII